MGTPLLWIAFNLFVLLMLALDLGVFHRRARAIGLGEAAAWSVVWVVMSLAFNLGLLHWSGKKAALEFFAGYLIEKSLSVDNIFIFVLLFKYFAVEPRHQHRVLFWGILGALVMRGAMIGAGVALIRKFQWVLYLFGAFLVYAGLSMMFRREEQVHPERNPVFRWARKFLPLAPALDGQKFVTHTGGLWRATPLLLVLIVVETTDLAFALDSIPAVFGVTRDPFIVYTSNVFAVLGLRAFYFLLAGVLGYFRYLGAGLSLVLVFIGAKMLGEPWLAIPTHVALAVVGGILGVAILSSIVAARVEARTLRGTKPVGKHQPAQAHQEEAARLEPQIQLLADSDPEARATAARAIHGRGVELSQAVISQWLTDPELAALLLPARHAARQHLPFATVGIAVRRETFTKLRVASGSPPLADVPADQDALEFSVDFGRGVRLDILTARSPGGAGAIARFLEKFGEGIQQVEYETSDVDRATELLRGRFGQRAIYPQTRPGADGARVNFFLVEALGGKKVLLELVEPPHRPSPARAK